MRKYLFLLSSVAIAVPVAAQDAPLTAEERYEQECQLYDCNAEPRRELAGIEPVRVVDLPRRLITVTATGTPIEVEDTGQAVTIIDRAEIEAVQGADIARILRRAPGVTLSRNGGTGSFTGVRIRGAQAEQTLVLVDGVRAGDPAAPSGGFDFGTLLPGTIAEIDLLRGSNSTIWGSEAIGGVMAITTRAETGLTGSAEYGSRDSFTGTLAGGLEGGAGFIGLAGGYMTTNGFSAAEAGTEADGFEQFALSARGTAFLSNTIEAFASARYAEGDLDIDGFPAPAFTLNDTAEFQETRQYSASVGVSRDTGPLYVQARYSFADTERSNFNPAFGTAPGFTSDGHSDRVDLRGEWRPIGPVLLAFGGEADWTSLETNFTARQTTRIAGAYAQAGIEFRGISGHLGMRHDDHARFGGATSFGADISYELADDLRLRASVGEGFKAPTLFQLFSDFGNETLRPEKSTGFDLGLAWKDRSQPFHAGITAFRRDSEDLIDFVSCFGVTGGICVGRPFGTYDNVERARSQGVEVEAGAALGTARVRLAYAYVDSEDRTAGSATQGNALARRPKHAATLSGDWPLADTGSATPTLGFDIRYVSDSFDDAFNTVPLDDYLLLDLRAELALNDLGGEKPLVLFGRIENVTGQDYQTAAGYAQPGTGVFGGVRFGF